jgi:hypothetical protein
MNHEAPIHTLSVSMTRPGLALLMFSASVRQTSFLMPVQNMVNIDIVLINQVVKIDLVRISYMAPLQVALFCTSRLMIYQIF